MNNKTFLFLVVKPYCVSFVYVDRFHNQTTGSEPHEGSVIEAHKALTRIITAYPPSQIETIFA